MIGTDTQAQAFGAYARYYDLLYREKDYAGEAAYVQGLINCHAPGAQRLLELGCGTGGHAVHLALLGNTVHGIDLSEGMLAAARERTARLEPALASRLSFEQGDARSYRFGRTFDAVVSLFHVMSYQQTNTDLTQAFDTANAHLEPGGLFVFDFWYGPAVLCDPPAVRVRRLADERTRVSRIAEPLLRPNDNVVEVHYDINVEDLGTGKMQQIRELHSMRYLFLPELECMANGSGFELVDRRTWLSESEPSLDSWNVAVCCRKKRAKPLQVPLEAET